MNVVSRAAFITCGGQPINQWVASYLLGRGFHVTLQFESQSAADRYADSLQAEDKLRYLQVVDPLDDLLAIQAVIDDSIDHHGGMLYFIHGNEMLDEDAEFINDPNALGEETTARFRRLYMRNRCAISYMAKQRGGHLIFPLISDTLYYAGYPSSPMLNQGKISMMKSLARELAPFRIAANAITFGAYDNDFTSVQKKQMQKTLDIYNLKPSLPKLQDMVPAIDMLLDTSTQLFSGQNLHIGVGLDTAL